jgi:anti-anti-sigma factor
MSDIPDRPASTLRLSITAADSPAGALAPEVVVVSIAGDLDRCSAPALEACLSRLLGSAAYATLTVDLTRTDFLDVGGLNVLIAAARRASAMGRPLRLVGCSRYVLRLVHSVEAVALFETVAGAEQPCMRPHTLPRTAHTDLPLGRLRTPHAADKPATTSRPRPRRAVRSTRGDVGTEEG